MTERRALRITFIFLGRLLLAILVGWGSFFLAIGLQLGDWSHAEGGDGVLLRLIQKWAPIFFVFYLIGLVVWLVKGFYDKSAWHILVVWFPLPMLGYWFWLMAKRY